MSREIDKSLIIRRFSRAIGSYDSSATIQRKIAEGLVFELQKIYAGGGTEAPQRVLEVGCGTGLLSQLLFREFRSKSLLLNDLCPEMRAPLSELLEHTGVKFRACDAEEMELPAGLDLIASSSVIQWFSRPYDFLERCHRALRPGGLLAIATFGPENLHEVATITKRTLEYRGLEKIPRGFSTIFEKKESITLEFQSPLEVLHHIRKTGVNALVSTSWTRQTFRNFTDSYIEKFGTPHKTVTLTYQPQTIILRREK